MLPSDIWLDKLHHARGKQTCFWPWNEQEHQAGFRRTFNGQWRLSWLTCYGENEGSNCSLGLNTCTLMDTDTMKVGTLPFDPFADDLTALPSTLEEPNARLDRTNLAVVCNPDAIDRAAPADKAQPGSGFAGQVLERHACAGAQ